MIVFIINLKESSERRMKMQAQLDETKLKYEFINAVNGKDLSETELKEIVYDYPNCMLSKGEIGCALSHLLIYKKMANENIEQALILEDDATLPHNIEAVISKTQRIDKLTKPNIYLLSCVDSYIKNQKIDDNVFKVYQAIRSHAYIINKKAAKRLISFQTPIKYEADMWWYFRYFNCANIYCIIPSVIPYDDETKSISLIENERLPLIKLREKYRSRLRKTIRNYQYYRLKDLFLKKTLLKIEYNKE
ncbi:glycosyltransferase family 25 protein [Providencia sp.]|uniref:glycosyltransferase family 25 protein n=1 Tax=Providencia sp. TaxID=589 RepID=UPI0035B0D1DE